MTDTAPVAEVFVLNPELDVNEVTPALATVIEPAPFVMVIPVPWVKAALVNPVPLPMSNSPFEGVEDNPVPPEAIGNVPVVKTLVDVAYTAPPDVNDVKLVPPLAVGSVPDTCVVKPILPHEGAVLTPPEIRALPVATSANVLNVFVAEA